jgi:hypothetical protein
VKNDDLMQERYYAAITLSSPYYSRKKAEMSCFSRLSRLGEDLLALEGSEFSKTSKKYLE